ncbi:MAG: hypothetical protein JWL77_4769 [Chthonomonadaceae bacterium]|nr:hypothetical protein [Chthonomonadaceae bacterium]
MKLKRGNPGDPKVIAAIVETIRKMTPEEALAFLTYRTPGVEETDMTGMYSNSQSPQKSVSAKRRVATK